MATQPTAPATFPDVTGLSVSRAALTFVEAGIGIVPFNPSRGKVCGNLVYGNGLPKWWEQVTTDREQISAWRDRFGSFNRLALATSPGAYGAVALDVDRPDDVSPDWWAVLETVPFIATRPQADPRRGHYWFTHGQPLANRPYPWGEVRSVGGGIVLPPLVGNARKVVRSGPLPTLPAMIAATVAGAVPCAPVSLQAFFDRYAHVADENRERGKLKGIGRLYDSQLRRTGSRHKAAEKALWVGFGESRIGATRAANVYAVIRRRWDKSENELRRLAAWCASAVETRDVQAIADETNRDNGTDSRRHTVKSW